MENKTDLVVCEMAHFGRTEVEPYIDRLKTDKLIFNHVYPLNKFEDIDDMSKSGKYAFDISYAKDGDTVELLSLHQRHEITNRKDQTDMAEMIGPLLSDADFFGALDEAKLPEICKAAKDGDFTTARKLFASHARASLDPEKFFSIPGKVAKPELSESRKATAERALRHELCSCGVTMKFGEKVDWFANPTYNQYKEWTWQLSRHSELKALAEAYRATGDERYAEGCAELFDSWVKQAIAPELNTKAGNTLCWRTIECGNRMGLIWQDIIHSFIHSPAFTDDLLIDWYKSVYEHAVRLRHKYTKGNWLIHELNGLAQVGIIYPEFRDSREWTDFSVQMLSDELDIQVYPDGMQYELTTWYHTVVIRHYLSVIAVANTYGYPIPKHFMGRLESMVDIFIKLTMADGCTPDINDGLHDPSAKHVKAYACFFPDNQTFKWIISGGKRGVKPDYTSLCLPYSGMAIFRSGWDTSDVTGFFDAAPFGVAHQHEDKLNLLIYANGRCLLGEGNKYAYDTSDIRKYVLSTRAHNTVRINGMDQNRRKGYKWNPEMLNTLADMSFTTDELYDRASGIYDEGYGELQERIATHGRKVVFVKKPKQGQPFFVVADTLASEKENCYEFMWHFDVDDATITDNGIKTDYITAFLCGDTGSKEIVTGVDGPEAQGWICRSSIQGSNDPVPTLIHKVKGKDIFTVTVFSVHNGGESPVRTVTTDGESVTVFYKDGEREIVTL